MRTVGIICEYNPFHRGHAYQIQEARRKARADFVVCLMSGTFTQRGEPALLSPHTRAHMALLGGADVILELPTLYAVRCAEQFAWGGVYLLHHLGIDALSFGCETDDLDQLQRWSGTLLAEGADLQAEIRRYLDMGWAYPRARAAALRQATGETPPNLPNLSLALEYLAALRRLDSPMEVIPVQRQGAGYHSTVLDAYASASALRAAAQKNDTAALERAMPDEALSFLQDALRQGAFVSEDALSQAYLYALRCRTPADLARLLDMGEGLENRITQAAALSGSRKELLDRVKTKRYPYARLSRLLCYALLGMDQAFADAHPNPAYVRLLGMRKSAGPLLRILRERAAIPLITRAGDPRLRGNPVFALEARAFDLWTLGLHSPGLRGGGRIYAHSPVIL